MRKLHYLFFIWLVLFGCSPSLEAQQQEDEFYSLGNAVIGSLQNNDADAFLQAHITSKDYEELTKKSSRIASKKEKATVPSEEGFEKMEEDYKSNFEEIIQNGITKQINWKEVNFFRIENATVQTNENNLPVIHNPLIVFTYKGEEMKLQAEKIVRLSRGWVVAGKLNIQ